MDSSATQAGPSGSDRSERSIATQAMQIVVDRVMHKKYAKMIELVEDWYGKENMKKWYTNHCKVIIRKNSSLDNEGIARKLGASYFDSSLWVLFSEKDCLLIVSCLKWIQTQDKWNIYFIVGYLGTCLVSELVFNKAYLFPLGIRGYRSSCPSFGHSPPRSCSS